MRGRFFSGSLVLPALILGTTQPSLKRAIMGLTFLTIYAPTLASTVFSPAGYANPSPPSSGIANERGFYYQNLGLSPIMMQGGWFVHPLIANGRIVRQQGGKDFIVSCNVGIFPYAADSGAAFINPLALMNLSWQEYLPGRETESGTMSGPSQRVFIGKDDR